MSAGALRGQCHCLVLVRRDFAIVAYSTADRKACSWVYTHVACGVRERSSHLALVVLVGLVGGGSGVQARQGTMGTRVSKVDEASFRNLPSAPTLMPQTILSLEH